MHSFLESPRCGLDMNDDDSKEYYCPKCQCANCRRKRNNEPEKIEISSRDYWVPQPPAIDHKNNFKDYVIKRAIELRDIRTLKSLNDVESNLFNCKSVTSKFPYEDIIHVINNKFRSELTRQQFQTKYKRFIDYYKVIDNSNMDGENGYTALDKMRRELGKLQGV